ASAVMLICAKVAVVPSAGLPAAAAASVDVGENAGDMGLGSGGAEAPATSDPKLYLFATPVASFKSLVAAAGALSIDAVVRMSCPAAATAMALAAWFNSPRMR